MTFRYFFFHFRRKCEAVRDVDGMEPKDLTASRSLYTNTQIKIRYIFYSNNIIILFI